MEKRNYGIDALRLFAMFQIVSLHLLGRGGILSAADGMTGKLAWLLEVAAYGAVNCYGLISGYVSYSETEKPYRYSKYASLWLQVFFYTFPATLIAILLNTPGFGWDALPRAIFPVSSGYYWYFTAYTIVFFLTPWLNRMLRGCDVKTLTAFVAAATFFLCAGSFLGNGLVGADPFRLHGGYSFVWLIYLWIVGAWLKKCDLPAKIPLWISGVAGLFCLGITYLFSVILSVGKPEFLSYISPTVFVTSLCVFLLFARLRVGKTAEKIISFASPAAFGVYLCHVQTVSWNRFLNQRYAPLGTLPAWAVIPAVLGSTAGLFLLCLLIEKFRLWLFRVTGIDAAAQKLWENLSARLLRKDRS